MIDIIATIPPNINFTLDKLYTISEKDTIGERIRKLRELKDMTTKGLGEKIGITSAEIINYENNNAYSSAHIILKLYALLGQNMTCDDYSNFITSKYWEKLKVWRVTNNLTQKEAAIFLQIAERAYYSWEKCNSYITRHTFNKIKN
ncbi:helix-turn-helix transcriptional regulator [Clostridium botulinum]|uniref:Putative DNA-binding protein n=1 Tax=Clostridium botulinum (strain Langeland / NCTC 10281 / Type F) TaxID=441772 RepID=A7GFR1_CLOBL|nr:helix-turn-helix transcriptional regulator [Clostridium botulinum]ABS42704.1 putative DNA-binding protein [Clostridium botulinum F str. Langeland]ADG00031.1 putative DNA-binding protein [Clostridium botulinum F str. 230613]KKM42412.1 XRE family transcriptional regulator [Clostridium botulinum]MBY6793102.1 helix-turn-helix transcriptional regulator [Clostridium botulinum]MBY6937312.1 helix-turn-helix transcriptional regulator [Clostridium botulinum]